MKLAGRVALVTGGGGTIGSAVARRFDTEGATVVVADVPEDAAADVAATLAHDVPLALDVADSAAWNDAVARIVSDHGGVDVLVNNAGTHVQALVEEMSTRSGTESSVPTRPRSSTVAEQ
jgi:NAD(P)-dependent dehydrogenase (short-subunit alcohol dehydrogenase family)